MANLFRVPTKLEIKLKSLSLMFSNSTASEPSTFAVTPAISYFVETLVLIVFSSLIFLIWEI